MERSQARNRTEFAIVLMVCAAIPALPLVVQSDEGFCQRPQVAISSTSRTCYTIYAPNGNQLPESQFGLAIHRSTASLVAGHDRTIDSLHDHGNRQNVVSQHVARHLRAFPELPFVVVLRRVIGDRDGKTVDILKARSWVVFNPVSTVDPESIPPTACAG